MSDGLAPKWSPLGIAQRLQRTLDAPLDAVLAVRIAWFILRAPAQLRRNELSAFVARLRAARAREFKCYGATLSKIDRIRQVCLKIPALRNRDMCYMRALTLYRFLDVEEGRLQLHLGIEHRTDPAERLRGHAWVTLDGQLLEGPDAVREGRVRPISLRAQR